MADDDEPEKECPAFGGQCKAVEDQESCHPDCLRPPSQHGIVGHGAGHAGLSIFGHDTKSNRKITASETPEDRILRDVLASEPRLHDTVTIAGVIVHVYGDGIAYEVEVPSLAGTSHVIGVYAHQAKKSQP